MTKELVALVESREMGLVRQGRGGKLSFIYAEEWRFCLQLSGFVFQLVVTFRSRNQ